MPKKIFAQAMGAFNPINPLATPLNLLLKLLTVCGERGDRCS